MGGMGEMRKSCKRCLKTEGKRPPGGLRHRLEDDIKMNLEEVWCEDVDWVCLSTESSGSFHKWVEFCD
jgi:hypothetical protein